MRAAFLSAMLSALFTMPCVAENLSNINISSSSLCLNGVELRSGAKSKDALKYISYDRVTNVLGKPEDTFVAGLGVTIFAWPSVGIHVQRGFRGAEKGKIFKFQVWFVDTYNKDENKYSGKFRGHVRVSGIDIKPETAFDDIRSKLKKAGFEIQEYQHVISAKKGDISIFTVDTSNQIERIEVWCI